MSRVVSVALLLAGALASGGCGRAALERPLPPTAPDAGAADATPPVGAQGCPTARACNDDPTEPALAGTCMVLGEHGEYWTCTCNAGFSNNPETGLCRAGSRCVASEGDAWSYADSLDSFDCALRPILACADGPPLTEQRTTDALMKVITAACGPEFGLMVRVQLRGGCPMLLEAARWRSSINALDLKFLQCIEAILPEVRFDCDEPTACALLEWVSAGPLP
jgi:hypothetical protein